MGRRPDYILSVLDKRTNGRTQAGAAWLQDDDSLAVVLNPCVTLTAGPDLVIRLFPNEAAGRPAAPPRRGDRRGAGPAPRPAPYDDDDDGEGPRGPVNHETLF